MADYFASYMVASRKEGGLLDTSLDISTREPKLVENAKGIFDEIIHRFGYARFCCEYFPIYGLCRGEKISNFSGTNSTQTHEATHRELHKIWSTPEVSFDEGLAYAVQHTTKDLKMAKRFRGLSLKLGPIQEQIQKRQAKRGLHPEDYTLIEEVARDYPLVRSQKNWATLLTVAANVRYFAFFHDVIKNRNDDAKAIITDAAELARDNGLRVGLEYLARFVDFNPLFADEEYSPEPTNGEVVVSTRPIWHPKRSAVSKTFVAEKEEDLSITISSKHPEAVNILKDVVQAWTPILERSLDLN
jgi:hypothetical protein